MSDSSTMPSDGGERPVRHTLGIDLGTSSLRLQIAHFDPLGRAVGEPAAVHLPHSERDGMLPSVLQLSPEGKLLAYGRDALQRLTHSLTAPSPDAPCFVTEFKPCLGQAPEDLAAQGRPGLARLCSNPACPRPGWAWSVSLQFCGFCGAPLTASTERWHPQFPYAADEAREYVRLLLSEVRLHLERRLNEPLRAQSGWQIVAGVPVHWQAGTRASYHQVLAQAFPEAGIALLSEPEGALRYYGCQGLVRAGEGWTLVVDFGAGTTDLVLGRVFRQAGEALLGEVRAYGERYGGADFDLLLAQHAAAELGVGLDPLLLTRWKLEAQRWKEAFSDAAQSSGTAETGFSFPVPTGERGCDFRTVVLDRDRFHRIAGELVERFRSVLDRGLSHFGISGSEIEQVVLTGGGAQWYFVEGAVREVCPQAHVVGGVEPVRAIARGLALAPSLPQLLEAAPRRERELQPDPDPLSDPQAQPAPEPLPRPEPGLDEFQHPKAAETGRPGEKTGPGREPREPVVAQAIIKRDGSAKTGTGTAKPLATPSTGGSVNWWAIAVLVALFLWNVWPTSYSEVRENGSVVPGKRVNRFNGKVQIKINDRLWVDQDSYKRLGVMDRTQEGISNSPRIRGLSDR